MELLLLLIFCFSGDCVFVLELTTSSLILFDLLVCIERGDNFISSVEELDEVDARRSCVMLDCRPAVSVEL